MTEQRKDWVQCFYNCTYNHGGYKGQLRFICGFAALKLRGDCESIKKQILSHRNLNEEEVFNFNIKTLTPFHDEVFTTKEGE